MFEDRVVRMMKDWKRRLLEEGEARGEARGVARGRAEGEAVGEARGREQGLVEGILSVARNLLEEGASLDVIVRVTRLPLEDVRRLAAEMGLKPAGEPGIQPSPA